jgi:hypothetical protein
VLRPDLVALAEKLIATGRDVVSLDEVAETLGAVAIDSDEIDALFAFLEARGLTVGDPNVGLASSALPQVLTTARTLRTELGRTPRLEEIAARSGLGEDAVRRALLFAQTLGSGLTRRGAGGKNRR